MSRTILPAQLARDSVEALLAERGSPVPILYRLILLLVLTGAGLLPVVRVPVWVKSPGIVRPAVEKHEVRAGVTGTVASVRVREYQRVDRGEVIATLHLGPLEARDSQLARQTAEARQGVRDLEGLLSAGSIAALPEGRLLTSRYRLERAHLLETLREQRQRAEQAAREEERARALLARDLLPRAEMERLAAAGERERIAADLLVQRVRREWETSLALQREALRELEARAEELRRQRELHSIVSPVEGTVEQLARVSPGSLVQAGEAVAVVSPGTAFIAEVLVSPREIGLLREGAPVRMRVDAFPSSDWGFLAGHVAEVPADVVLVDRAPRYRVKVALHARSLSLPDGTPGELRKGMTLEARFVLAERTLWQLLRDDVHDWLAPAPRRDGPA